MTDAPTSPEAPSPARKRWPYFVPLIVIAAMFGIFGKRLLDVERGADPRLIPTVLLDTQVPAFELEGLPGRSDPRGLAATDLKGDVTLVNVWGSWCIACVQEHPTLLQIAKENKVAIHGIDWRDTPDRGLAWLKQRGDPYARVAQDPHGEAAIAFGVTAAPESFLVDKNGVIRFKQVGPITPEVWRDQIAPLIEQLRK